MAIFGALDKPKIRSATLEDSNFFVSRPQKNIPKSKFFILMCSKICILRFVSQSNSFEYLT